MSDKSKIEWTDATWNCVTGCTKVSQGCHHCYAERTWQRLSAKGMPYEGRAFTDVRCHSERLDQPLRWKKPRRVFVNSMSDLFHEDVPVEFIHQVFAVMALAPTHTFQILTKRPERMRAYFRDYFTRHVVGLAAAEFSGKHHPGGHDCDPDVCNMEFPLPNVWLGISAEDQATAEERIPLLLQTPAAVRFVSLEPLLGPVNLTRLETVCPNGPKDCCGEQCIDDALRAELYCPQAETGEQYVGGIDWVIVGGESGPKARPMHPDWVRDIRDQCVEAGVPFFFKQFGEWTVTYDRDRDDPDWRRCPKSRSPNERYINLVGGYGFHGERVCFIKRVGKKTAGRELDGRTWDEYPK